MTDRITLREAVGRYKQERGAPVNAYDWYSKGAQRSGKVSLGNRRQLVADASTTVAVYKVGNTWMVDVDEFNAAITEHRAAADELKFITDEYDRHQLLVGPGGSLKTTFGSYTVMKDFHIHWNSHVHPRSGSGESWRCNKCWAWADLEHNKEECHTCSDWGGCGRDCRLSAVLCASCGTRMEV